MASYEDDLNRLKNAQRDAAVADLQNTRNQALSNLDAEQRQNASAYNQQRLTANAQNRLSAKNFQEYLATTGRANSGISAQARMQNANNLNTSLNYLNAGETSALADINRRRTDATNAYNTGLAGANAQIEANYIQNLLEQRDKERQRDLQERQFQESIRQFNENMALQRQQLYSRFSSGSGGGRRSSGGSSNNEQAVINTDNEQAVINTDNELKKTKDTYAVPIGKAKGKAKSIAGFSFIDTPVYTQNGKRYYKNTKGKLVEIK